MLAGLARTEAAIESIGVMPEPAAMQRCRPGLRRVGAEAAGGRRHLDAAPPGATSRMSHDENIPPGISRTPIRGAPPAGAQIE